MSGFVAVVNTDGAPVDRGLLARLTGGMAFRGPDAQRVWCDGPVGLGHTLLATVDDYPEVPQPCSLDGRVWLAGDVRVDGRSELVAKLKDHVRAPLATASDPELVLHAYHAWGEQCVEHLIGDFAFAVWDGGRQQLFCARDQMGVKPIYYARTPRALVVSNTLDAVRTHPAVADDLNGRTVSDYLLFGELADPTLTAYRQVERVPAASRLVWNGRALTASQYWTLPIDEPVRFRRASEYVERFRELFGHAVADRLRGDRPVGILMSGGLDSSSVAAVARHLSAGALGPVHAQSTVYDSLVIDEERRYAGSVATHLGIPIRYVSADGYELYQEPSAGSVGGPGPANGPMRALYLDACARMANQSRVALTGQGGDAVLLPWPGSSLRSAGSLLLQAPARAMWSHVREYRRVPRMGFRSAWRRRRGPSIPAPPPGWIRGEFAAGLGPTVPQHIREAGTRLARPEHPHRQSAYESLTSPFWDLLFEGYDAATTQQPLEFRHPLLDVRLVRYALTVPSFPWCAEKHLLRESMRGCLPDDVRLRPKAPARGDAVLSRLRAGRSGSLEPLRASPELQEYIHLDRVPSVDQLVAQPSKLWESLRPYSFANWLQHRHVSVRGGVATAA